MNALSQAKILIDRSHCILIAPAQPVQGDSLGSALALFFTLKKLGKNANLLTEKIPEKFQFLTNSKPISSRDFIISINGQEKEISEMRYEKNEKGLKIYLALNKGEISEQDVSFSNFNQNPDLLITLGASSLEDLGSFFKQNSQLFYQVPVINIDNHPANDNFGEVNLIEMTSPLAETSANLIKLLGTEDLIGQEIATSLLTGIVFASQNFRNSKTRPKTFETSALLINKGANHQKIIQQLYKQKTIAQIKLLGKILQKLNFNKDKELYFTSLTEGDFQGCGARPKDLSFVLEELKFNFRYLPNLLILWESHASQPIIKGVFYSSRLELIDKILKNYEGVAKRESVLFLIRDSDLSSAQEKALNVI